MIAKNLFALIAAGLVTSTAHAQYTDGVVKIGILTDMTSLYADLTGAGSVATAKLAVEDFDPAAKGMQVEVVAADHQNKADIGSSGLTGSKCNANTIHWTYDTWNLAQGTGSAVVKDGGDTWLFVTADYAFGQALERDTSAAVVANGGKILGRVRHPLNTNDFSSFLLQAQASKPR